MCCMYACCLLLPQTNCFRIHMQELFLTSRTALFFFVRLEFLCVLPPSTYSLTHTQVCFIQFSHRLEKYIALSTRVQKSTIICSHLFTFSLLLLAIELCANVYREMKRKQKSIVVYIRFVTHSLCRYHSPKYYIERRIFLSYFYVVTATAAAATNANPFFTCFVQRTNVHGILVSIHRCSSWIMSQKFSHGENCERNSNARIQ